MKVDPELAWLAGVLEGEGCVTITSSPHYAYAAIYIVNTDRQMLEPFQHRWPARLDWYQPKSANNVRVWRWSITGTAVVPVLEALLPQVRTERVRAKIVHLLSFQRCRIERQGRKRTQEEKDAETVAIAMIRQMNKRGVAA